MNFTFFTIGFFILFSLMAQTHAQTSALFSCLDSINNDYEFSGNPRYPNEYYFSIVNKTKNQFLLLNQKQSYLCTTHESLKPSSVIDIMQNVPNISKKITYFQTTSKKELPQKKGNKNILNGKYLIAHQSFDSAIELPSENTPTGSKNIADCKVSTDQKLLDEGLVQIIKSEILDLQADWAEKVDSLSMGYGPGFNRRTQQEDFENKMKSVLENCSQVNQLKDVVQTTATRTGLKINSAASDANNSKSNNTTRMRPALRSATKQ